VLAEIEMLTIQDICADIPYSTQIGPFGKALTPEDYTDSGVPLLRGINVNRGRFFDDGFVFVSEEIADSLEKYVCRAGEVILVHKGTIGQIGIIPEKTKFSRYLMGNSMLRVVVDKQKMLPDFLFYWMCSNDAQWYLQSRLSTVGVPQLHRPLDTLRKLPVPNLSIKQQQRILQPLTLLDSLIENNANLTKYLNEYMNSLFRSWFIDFDPVKAKAEGKLPYGMDKETAALFPDTFEDSELGPIPTGWKIGMMEDVLSRKQDTTTPGEHLSERYYVPIDNIDSKSLTLKNWLPYDDAVSSLILFSKNDLLFGAMRPYFHKVTIAPFDGITRSTCFVFKPKVPETRGFSLCLLNLDSTIRYSTDSSLGSTMPYAIWKNGLARHKIVLPPSQIMVAFSETISPLIDKIRDVGLSVRSLSSVRDVMLPRLISGELPVS
jgi:type I restriction enzyme, S subunit